MARKKKAKRVFKGNFTPCDICMSPYRTEIEAMLRAKMSQREIAEKYKDKFPGCKKITSLRQKVFRHNRHLSQATHYNLLQMPEGSPHPSMPRVSMEQFAQRMLQIGNKALDFYELHPKEIKLGDVIATQRLLLDKQRLTIHEDALKLAMARIFGGFSMPTDAIEGEVVDDPKLPKPPGAILPGDKK